MARALDDMTLGVIRATKVDDRVHDDVVVRGYYEGCGIGLRLH